MWQTDGIPLDILYLKLHLLCAGPLYLPVKWQWSLTLQCFLSLAHLSSITKFFCKFNWFLSFHMIRALFVLIISFSYLSKLIISIEYPSKDLQNFFHEIFTSVYIILSFYTIKWLYRRNWKSRLYMFTYFCCGYFSGLFLHPFFF